MCFGECPVTAIRAGKEFHEINPQTCIDCGACAAICPVDAISPAKAAPKKGEAPEKSLAPGPKAKK